MNNNDNIDPPFGTRGQDPSAAGGQRNNIEDFIRRHRDAFDDLKAPQGMFDKIVPRESKVHPLWKWVAVAASALLLLSIGYIAGNTSRPEKRFAGWKEFQEAEQFYQSRINVKMEEIKTLPVSTQVLSDIQILDEVYAQMRQKLIDDPNTEPKVLLHAMIKHQKQKLDVMQDILNRASKYKTNEKHINHEI